MGALESGKAGKEVVLCLIFLFYFFAAKQAIGGPIGQTTKTWIQDMGKEGGGQSDFEVRWLF